MHKLFPFLLIVFFASCRPQSQIKANQEGVSIHLHGKKYEQMFLEGHPVKFSINDSYSHIKFEGQSQDGYNWFFPISDSIAQSMLFFYIKTDTFNYQTKTDHLLMIRHIDNGDTLKTFWFVPDREQTTVDLHYVSSDKRTVDQYEVDDTLFWEGPIHIVNDLFSVNFPKNNSELEIILKIDKLDYWHNLNRLDSLSQQYPDSKYLMSLLPAHIYQKEKLKKIYDQFSEKNRDSFIGEKVAHIINFNDSSFHFDNIKLKRWDTHDQEFIVQNSTKYTLIILSASWCGACHRLVPLLKKLYELRNENLDMVTISVDDNRTVHWWTKTMKGLEIPWRSVVFSDDNSLHRFLEKYPLTGIPSFILVAPNGYAKKIEIASEKDINSLLKIR
jgi:thiol-disulfide isomerase/thioredoxin